jgi:sporulation protein YlmC with PRC-barrel domain
VPTDAEIAGTITGSIWLKEAVKIERPRVRPMNIRPVAVIILSFGLVLSFPLPRAQAQTKEVQIVKVDPSMIKRGFRASKLIGSQVTNEKNEKIGEIDEIIIDAANKATFAVLEVGGFLGLGAHKIAVPYETLRAV